jgi:basic membrane protein A
MAALAIAAAALCFSAPSCARKAAKAGAAAEPLSVALALDYPGAEDLGLNASAWKGFREAAAKAQARLSDGRTNRDFGSKGSFTCLYPRAEGRDREQLLRTLAESGNSLIILLGGSYAEGLKRVSPSFPKTRFVLLDSDPLPGYGSNCCFVGFDLAQGAYLAGALAGKLSAAKENAKLGFVGDRDAPGAEAMLAGWLSGARRSNPDLLRPGSTPSQLLFPAAGKTKGLGPLEAVSKLAQAGVSSILWDSGEPGADVLEDAKSAGATIIGVRVDLAAKLAASGLKRESYSAVLGSVAVRLDLAIPLILERFGGPGAALPASAVLGVKEGCVELVTDEAYQSLVEPQRPYIDSLRSDLAEGKLDAGNRAEGEKGTE